MQNPTMLGVAALATLLAHAASPPTYEWVFKVADHGLAYAHMSTIEAVPLVGAAPVNE
jgi:hypothetical protein